MKKRRNTSLRYKALRFLCGFFGFIFVMMLSVTLLSYALLDRYALDDHRQLITLTQEKLDNYLEDNTFWQNIIQLNDSDSGTLIGGKKSKIVNILLIGQDRRPGEERARSDTLILCSFHTRNKTLTMTSFLRDLYVPIPGYRDNRINAAYAAGGIPLIKQTLQENFGVYIDGCVEVDFTQFSRIIDLLGGVPIELRQDEATYINNNVSGSQLSSGTQLLNGEQALIYARIRKLDADGDFSRTNRQRKIISTLLEQCRGADISQLTDLARALLPMVSTDLSEGKILVYAAQLLPMFSDMEIISQQIPAEGTYTQQSIDSMAVLVPDLEQNRAYLVETLLGE